MDAFFDMLVDTLLGEQERAPKKQFGTATFSGEVGNGVYYLTPGKTYPVLNYIDGTIEGGPSAFETYGDQGMWLFCDPHEDEHLGGGSWDIELFDDGPRDFTDIPVMDEAAIDAHEERLAASA